MASDDAARAAVVVARRVIDLLRAEDFAAVAAAGAPDFRRAAEGGAIASGWATIIAACGTVQSVGPTLADRLDSGAMHTATRLKAEHGDFTVLVVVAPGGILLGLRLVPEDRWVAPDYVDTERFSELQLALGAAPLAVPAALALPNGPGPFPAVVLLGGSGPMDRDETITPDNKVFKDIAWGLASRGVASLRFDKVTRIHPDRFLKDSRSTTSTRRRLRTPSHCCRGAPTSTRTASSCWATVWEAPSHPESRRRTRVCGV